MLELSDLLGGAANGQDQVTTFVGLGGALTLSAFVGSQAPVSQRELAHESARVQAALASTDFKGTSDRGTHHGTHSIKKEKRQRTARATPMEWPL